MAFPMRVCLPFTLLISGFLSVAAGAASPHVSVSLLCDTAAVEPAKPFNLGILLQIDPDWHIYWSNPGDSGMATRVKLDLPPGFTAGPVQYPIPTFLRLPGDIINYAYQNRVMLIVPVTPPDSFNGPDPSDLNFAAKIDWLVCKDVCLPGSMQIGLRVPVSNASPNVAQDGSQDLFFQWTQRLPRPQDQANIQTIKTELSPTLATVRIHWKNLPADIQLFPALVNGFDVGNATITTTARDTVATYPLSSPAKSPLPARLDAVLTYTPAGGQRVGVNVSIENPSTQPSAAHSTNSSPNGSGERSNG